MANVIARRKLGTQGLEVSALGLGCMGFSGMYRKDDLLPDDNAVNVIKHAFDRGVTFFDTSDVYGPHINEVLLGKALKMLPREKIQLATKFGIVTDQKDSKKIRGEPEYVRKCCEDSLKRLDLEYIDLYYQHRVDQIVPIEVTMGELKKLVKEGKIKYIGLSEAAPDTIRRAHAVHPISAVQIEWSLWARDVEDEVIPVCRELGIGIVPYSPLGRGFFTGKASVEALHAEDTRSKGFPRFQAQNLEKNRMLYERVAALAKKHGCSPGQLALSWVCSQKGDVVPIPGTTKIANLDSNLEALNVALSSKELQEVSAAVPASEVAGGRFTDGSWMDTATFKHAITPSMASWKPSTAKI